MSGGSGSRLWPSSRASLPKQFIKLPNGTTLFGNTIKRVTLNQRQQFTIISNKTHDYLCRRELSKQEKRATYIFEEEGRNTASAILTSALNASADDILLILPADHWISDNKAFNKIIQTGLKIASSKNCWVTFGIKPNEPETGYGYIKATGEGESRKVQHFKEKPDTKTAESYLTEGDYFWNSGIFVVNVAKCIESFKQHQTDLYKTVVQCWKNRYVNGDEITLSREYLQKIRSMSVDYAILEKETNIAMIPFESHWSDVGSWDNFLKIFKIEETNNNPADNIVQIDAQNNFIYSPLRAIAAVGVKDLIIVNDDNATLVVQKGQSDKVKDAVEILKSLNLPAASKHTFEYRPWGMFENLLDSEICKVKRITVNPWSSFVSSISP